MDKRHGRTQVPVEALTDGARLVIDVAAIEVAPIYDTGELGSGCLTPTSLFRISGANNSEGDVRNSRKSKHMRTRRRQIDYATTHKRAPIVYTDHRLTTVLAISYFDHRS
jgi:hypothetical protein